MDVLVVSISSRADRRKKMLNWLPKDWNVKFTHDEGISWEENDALHWREHGLGLYPWQIPHENAWWSRPLKLGEIGCAMTHYECWKMAKRKNLSRCIILEDDCAPGENFKERTTEFLDNLEQFDSSWDFAYLGRERLVCDEQVILKQTVRPGYSYGTYAYALSALGAGKLLKYDFEKAIIPVDEFIAATFAGHPRKDIRRLISPTLNAYAAAPDIYFHLDPISWGSDTESTPFVQLLGNGA